MAENFSLINFRFVFQKWEEKNIIPSGNLSCKPDYILGLSGEGVLQGAFLMGKSTPILEMGESVKRGGANSHSEGERREKGG